MSRSLALPLLLMALSLGTLCVAAEKSPPLSLESDSVTSQRVEDGRVETYIHIVITHGDVKVTANKAVSFRVKGKPLSFTCTGSPLLTEAGLRIIAERIVLTPRISAAACSGKVKMLIPAVDGKTEKHPPIPSITIFADTLQYDYAAKSVSAHGHVKVLKGDQTLTGDACTFDMHTGAVEVKTDPKKTDI